MYLFMDTETGGLTPKHSLLTVSCIAVDEAFQIIPVGSYDPGLHLRIRHAEYALTAGALSVNKINLVEHNERGQTAEQASDVLRDYLVKACQLVNKKRLIPAGHNVGFDVQFVRANLMSDKQWDSFFTYPFFDTAAIARFLNAMGIHAGGYSLTTLRDKYLPHMKSQSMHNAENDNLVTIELAKKFIGMVGKQNQ